MAAEYVTISVPFGRHSKSNIRLQNLKSSLVFRQPLVLVCYYQVTYHDVYITITISSGVGRLDAENECLNKGKTKMYFRDDMTQSMSSTDLCCQHDLVDKFFCFENNHWTKYKPVVEYFQGHIADELYPLGLLRPCNVVYMVKFVDIHAKGHPLMFKYVGSATNAGRRILQHLAAIWTGESRKNGSLLMTSTGHKLLKRFNGDLRFFRVEILKRGIALDDDILHDEERESMFKERAFTLFEEGGLNVVDPVSCLYVLNGGVSLRHLQSFKFEDTWTVADFVNNNILPLTKSKGISYHEYLETHEDPYLQDAYRTVPDFFVASTCNNCLWKDILQYLHGKSSTSKERKDGDLRPKYLHDGGNLYVFLSFLSVNLNKDRRSWPVSATAAIG